MKRGLISFIMSGFMLGIFCGCQRDIPEPKTNPRSVSAEEMNVHSSKDISAAMSLAENNNDFFVQYGLRGNNLLVECIVTGISFRQNDPTKKRIGKIAAWVDGKKRGEFTAAAFIIKGLPSGNHRVMLEVLKPTNEPYGLKKEFLVAVPG